MALATAKYLTEIMHREAEIILDHEANAEEIDLASRCCAGILTEMDPSVLSEEAQEIHMLLLTSAAEDPVDQFLGKTFQYFCVLSL